MNHGGTEYTETHGGSHAPAAKHRANQLAGEVIRSAIEVHRFLGPGLLESAYEQCLARELMLSGIEFRRQVYLPIVYKGATIEDAFRIDVLVENLVVLELKAVEELESIHDAQLLTYLRLSNRWLGILINFSAPTIKRGMKRLVNQ